MTRFCTRYALAASAILAGAAPATAGNPYAASIESYDPGSPPPNLTDPALALGEPSRMNDDPFFVSTVTAFNPPFVDIVSIGPGGHLTVSFDSPIVDDPDHPFGIDLIVFGNSFFIDSDHPNGIVDGLLQDGGMIEISADGNTWQAVPGVVADGLYPTIGFQDSGPYDTVPGDMPTDFTRPVDPSLALSDFMGLDHEQIIELYDGAGGGAGVDIGAVGLDLVQYVRISNAPDAVNTVEVDGFAKVSPEISGDLNGDGNVDAEDLFLLLAAWGVCADPEQCPADLNDDGAVDAEDLFILLANWG